MYEPFEIFPFLHKIVLGLCDVELNQAVTKYGHDINERDDQGRTALWWAANTHQFQFVNRLLALGADTGIHDERGGTPLEALFNFESPASA